MTPPTLPSIRRARRAARVQSIIAAIGLLAASGCHFDLSRVERGTELDLAAFETLSEGESTLGDALETLGAPTRLEEREGRDYLWYLHEQGTRAGVRFQLPAPLTALGYRHTLVEVDESSDNVNALTLVFDEDHVLEHKSLKLTPTYAETLARVDTAWSFYLQPRAGVAPVLIGDAGSGDFSELFAHGSKAGLELGVLTAPVFLLTLGAHAHRYEGDDFRSRGFDVELEDMELYTLELGGRLQFPPEFFAGFWKLEEIEKLFLATDVREAQGPHFYFKWTILGFYNEEVDVTLDGAPAGHYFDDGFGLGSTVAGGFEYRLGRVALFTELEYQALDAFEDNGAAAIDTDADGMGAIFLTAGFSVRFGR